MEVNEGESGCSSRRENNALPHLEQEGESSRNLVLEGSDEGHFDCAVDHTDTNGYVPLTPKWANGINYP